MAEDPSPGRVPKSTDEEIKQIVRQKSTPVVKKEEVAEELDLGKRQVSNRLKALADNNEIIQKSVGQGYVWGPREDEIQGTKQTTDPTVQQTGDSPDPQSEFQTASVTDDNISDQTNFGVVDTLPLPGSGEQLLYRRQVIDEIFRYLFRYAKASRTELTEHLQNTQQEALYATDRILLNHHIDLALRRVIFFQRYENKWRLTKFARQLKEHPRHLPIWNNWSKNKEKIYDTVRDGFWEQLNTLLDESRFEGIETNEENTVGQLLRTGLSMSYIIEPSAIFWHDPRVHIHLRVRISDDSEARILKNNRDSIEEELSMPTTWRTTEDSPLEITTSTIVIFQPPQFPFPPSAPVLQLNDTEWVVQTPVELRNTILKHLHTDSISRHMP